MVKGKIEINARQMQYIVIVVAVVFKLINMPPTLAGISGRDSWITMLIMTLIDVVILTLFFITTKVYPHKTFYEILQESIGTVGRKVVAGLLGLYILVKLYFSLHETEQFLMVNLYDNTSWIPFGIPMVLFICFAAFKGLRAIGRATELTGVLLVGAMIFGLAVVATETRFYNILPVLENGFAPVLKGLEAFALGTGDTVVFFFFLGRYKEEGKTGRRLAIGMLISIVITAGFQVAFYAFYNSIAHFQTHGHALADMLQYMRGTDSFARMDIFVVLAMLVLALSKLMVLTWCFSRCVRTMMDWDETPKYKIFSMVPLVAIMILIEIFMQGDAMVAYKMFTGALKYAFVFPFHVVVPIGVPILAAVAKYRTKHGLNGDGGGAGDDAAAEQDGSTSSAPKAPSGEGGGASEAPNGVAQKGTPRRARADAKMTDGAKGRSERRDSASRTSKTAPSHPDHTAHSAATGAQTREATGAQTGAPRSNRSKEKTSKAVANGGLARPTADPERTAARVRAALTKKENGNGA